MSDTKAETEQPLTVEDLADIGHILESYVATVNRLKNHHHIVRANMIKRKLAHLIGLYHAQKLEVEFLLNEFRQHGSSSEEESSSDSDDAVGGYAE